MAYDKKTGIITTDGDKKAFESDLHSFMQDVGAQVTEEIEEKRRRQNARARRVWVAGSAAWVILVIVYVVIAQPYGSNLDDGEVVHMLLTFALPPCAAGVFYLLYRWAMK